MMRDEHDHGDYGDYDGLDDVDDNEDEDDKVSLEDEDERLRDERITTG